ncbi:hypothetical protein R3X27_23355 [Tropicimonas sp. TH_r6]|uniref:helix-turn-helix transcriptional regulator n=1 Tax=Tropicimonas sp. TH_r6 TaxID=3082085 RepID=UPI002952E395|nr:helix-turn-helix domain-containing protein [Tropicimonas sp. TH_r6]MDV7145631.1 hypothetical protein [Tropicimonas sp. TH_r6]
MNKNFAGGHAMVGTGPKYEVIGKPAALNTDPLLRDGECATMLNCSKATFWRRVADGTIPKPLKIGGMSRWKQSDIKAVIERAATERGQ